MWKAKVMGITRTEDQLMYNSLNTLRTHITIMCDDINHMPSILPMQDYKAVEDAYHEVMLYAETLYTLDPLVLSVLQENMADVHRSVYRRCLPLEQELIRNLVPKLERVNTLVSLLIDDIGESTNE